MATALLILAAAAGGIAASLTPMAACHCGNRTTSALKQRSFMLERNVPQRLKRLAGIGLLAGLLATGGLAAYAAQPPVSAPERLPGEMIGVTGSGDQLVLKLRQDQAMRDLKIGDEYRDGWKLQALSNSEATLAKAGEMRRIGLNPTGALTAEPAAGGAPAIVRILSNQENARIDAAIASGRWNGQASFGRTLEETRRHVLYGMIIDDALTAKKAAAARNGLDPNGVGVNGQEMRAALGDDVSDWEMLNAKFRVASEAATRASGDVNAIRILDGLPVIGPDSIYVAPGQSLIEAVRAAGLVSPVGYSFGALDAQGGRTMTRGTMPSAGGLLFGAPPTAGPRP